MAAELELVDVMTKEPANCLLCACAPVDESDENRHPLPAIHAVGLDVNWGEEVYVCWVCAGLIADLMDRPAKEKVQKILDQAKFQKKRADREARKTEKLQGQLNTLLKAKKAIREIRAEQKEKTHA